MAAFRRRMAPRWLATMTAAIALVIPARATLAQVPSPLDSIGARIDPYVARPRLIVITDIANEPDDQMSLVRLLVYSNQLDIEGLIANTSTWMKHAVRPDVIRTVIDAYAAVQPNLLKHATGFPTADALRAVVTTGQPTYGMAAVGPARMSPGAELIIEAADRNDPRPLWISVWGGANTLAQALLHVRATRTPAQLAQFVSKLRVYTISDQDDAGPWIRREFPALHYIAMPSPANGEQYYLATWTGISGDEFYRNAPGADFTTFTRNITVADATTARLSFLSGGPADSFGMLLDNVVLTAGTAVTSPVPEPSNLALVGAGIAVVGAAARRRRRR